MKRGTKIGWLLIAVSIVLSIWVIVGQSSKATETDSDVTLYPTPEDEDSTPQNITQDDGLVLSSDGTRIISYSGSGDSVTIPSTVTSGANAGVFSSNSNLKHIYVQPGNSTYASFGDCLYNSSMSTLIKVPNGLTTVQLYQAVSTIGESAFNGSSISEVSIPDSVTSIGSQGSWSPTTIYCSEGSAADKYAQNHSINAIYPTSSDGDEDDNTNTNGGTSTETNGGTSTNGGTASNTTAPAPSTTQTNSVTVNSTPQPAPQPAETAAPANTNASTTGGSSGRTGGHTQDATPKTADGDIDPRLILCFATLAAGIGILLYSRSRKKVIIAAESEHGLDD